MSAETALNGMKVLVTGSNGFLGPWLCEYLIAAGAEIHGLDNDCLPSSRIHALGGNVKRISADVEDFNNLSQICYSEKYNFIFHLAAQSLVGKAAANPLATFKSNIEGTWNILECARSLHSQQFLQGIVVASSDKAYGDHEVLPYVETAPLIGKFPYDVSKSCTDLLAQSYFHSYGLPVCVTRCGNIYGGGDFNFSRIVPGTIKSLIHAEHPVIRSDGTLIRDYVYVKDVADACIFIAKKLKNDAKFAGEAFNIADANPLSVIEIVKEISACMGQQSLEPIIESKATMEIAAQYLDAGKIKTLGWKPQFTRAEALRETISWYRSTIKKNNF